MYGEPHTLSKGHVREDDFFLTHAIWCNSYGSRQPETGVRSVRNGEVCDDFHLIEHGVADFDWVTPILLRGLRKGWTYHRIGEVAGRIYSARRRRESKARFMALHDQTIAMLKE